MANRTPAKTILLLGANGQVGHELARALQPLGSLIALDIPDIDFSQPQSLRTVVRKAHPDVIVNAAAHTAVDRAESEPDLAFAINATAPGVLAEEANALGVCLVHYSTDYVFDGRKMAPYIETDATDPQSVYGRSKLKGEEAVAACRKHLTFRTSWVIGAHGQNFLKTMLRLASERETLRVVADQHGAPTSAALLADITASSLSHMINADAGDTRWGLYHLVSAGETTWHALARHVIIRATLAGVSLKAGAEDIEPISTKEYPTPAKRPANSRLDTTRLRTTFDLTLPDWTAGVNNALDRIITAERLAS